MIYGYIKKVLFIMLKFFGRKKAYFGRKGYFLLKLCDNISLYKLYILKAKLLKNSDAKLQN